MSIEMVKTQDGCLATIIIRADYAPEQTTFITSPDLAQQVGFVVYPAGGEIKRHVHKILSREISATSEALMVRQGRLEIDIFDQERRLLTTKELHAGDFVLMVSGGHGFRVLEPTILLEVKLGPYCGVDEKEMF